MKMGRKYPKYTYIELDTLWISYIAIKNKVD